MKLLKKVLLVLVLLLSISLLSGCAFNVIRYDVEIIDNGYQFNDGFLQDHLTYGSYNNETQDYISNKSTPEEYTFVIKNNEEKNKIFTQLKDVDFEDEMIIVYIYTGIYDAERRITDVEIDEGELSIDFDYKLKIVTGSASIPQQRVLIIKMNRVNVYNVDVDED